MNTPIPLDEKDLLQKIATGDTHAFKIVYDRYRAQVYTFSLQYLKSTVQAEEVVQEVFLKLWLLGKRLIDIQRLESYILTLTRNKSLDMLRRMKLEAIYTEPLGDSHEEASHETEESILLNDTQKVLQAGIERLPPQQKRVYRLCHQDGLSYEQVAQQLQISPHTVHRHMKLALGFLRRYIQDHTDLAVALILLGLS